MSDSRVVTFRKLVMPKDLNPANRLFGGTMVSWIDESAALYVMCQAKTQNLVTLKFSEILFKKAVKQGDFLTFEAETLKIGKSSLTVNIEVFSKDVRNPELKELVCSCEAVFVSINPDTGLSVPHGLKNDE